MTSARNFVSFLLLVLLTSAAFAADLPTAKPESVGMSTQRLGKLKSEMQALVDRNQLPGVVTMVAKDGKVVEFEVAGKRDVESGAPLTKDAIFRIYSMSKPITGVAMMMLFEEGKWQLNDPVSKHIPEFANLKVAKVNPQTGAVTQVAPDHPMTMRELMSHSGGLTYGVFGSTPVDKMYTDVNVLDRDATLQAMIDKLGKIPLLHQPGERWHYSVSVDVQGYLVEKLSGQPFAEFLKQRIFDPLGMKDTAFYVPAEKLNRFVSFYTYDKDRKFISHPGIPDFSKPPGAPSGGGGLVSTAMDYMRFCQMLMNGGELDGHRLLSPLSVQLMRSNVLPANARTMSPGTGFGLDFAVVEDPVAAGGYGGEGTFYWGGYAGTWFWIDPVYKMIVVGMIQIRGDGSPDVRGLSRNLTYQAITSAGAQ
ncbi:MAG TPA: serine hydrolase domain-containing protein [Steroidobacteraceae bacterium]|nr:serine hydrolase domain-containing protein [Steroidobacteraceae bacterium]